MIARGVVRLWLFALLLLPLGAAAQDAAGPARAHGPSRITRYDGKYHYYATGTDCPMHVSPDMRHWPVGPPVLRGVPAWMHQLDKDTGKTDGPVVTTVGRWREGPEASYIHFHDGYYYLFESEGFCCRGVNSTYFVVMGRSREITRPYLDRTGHDDLSADVPVGGTVFLATRGDQIRSGQVGIYTEKGVDYLTDHYYSREESGRPTLGQGRVVWGADGWPQPASL